MKKKTQEMSLRIRATIKNTGQRIPQKAAGKTSGFVAISAINVATAINT